jgi:hypothetical protein
VVTIGCGDAMPRLPQHASLDRDLSDPSGIVQFRPIRDDIDQRARA